MGPDRLPVWPEGIIGSISHCHGLCAAAVARKEDILGLGLDVEPAEPLDTDLFSFILTDRERRLLKAPEAHPLPLWLRILFSAKESTYKCLHPLTKRVLDFRDIELTFRPVEAVFTVRPAPEVLPVPHMSTLECRMTVTSTHLATAAVVRPSELPPASSGPSM
jgi:4'-phosphopantetheinyl transferase EntD